MAVSRPGIFDYIDLYTLRLVKLKRDKREEDESFYDTFFTDEDVEKYLWDVRNCFRFWHIEDAYRMLFGDRPARVADIGSGLGMALRYLPDNAEYIGVEYSDNSRTIAEKTHAGRKADFRAGGYPDLPVENNWADLAVCLEVLEHVPDDHQAAGELFRIVKPGGHLLLSVPGTWYWPDYERLIGHYRHYTGESVRELVEGAGFELVHGYSLHKGLWRVWHYFYLFLKAIEIVITKTVKPDFSILRTRFCQWLGKRIENRVRRPDAPHDPASTFVLCRKPESDGGG